VVGVGPIVDRAVRVGQVVRSAVAVAFALDLLAVVADLVCSVARE
jgi:hypothetical protein